MTDGELRRASWHMDFGYQLDGITKEAGHIAVRFFNEEGELEFTPASLHVDGRLGVSESMVHYRGGKAAIDPAIRPDLESFWADLTAAYAEEVRRLGELGCTYLPFDDTSLVSQRPAPARLRRVDRR